MEGHCQNGLQLTSLLSCLWAVTRFWISIHTLSSTLELKGRVMIQSYDQMLVSVADPRPTSSTAHEEVKSFLS